MTSRAARGRLVALACCALAVSPAPALEACATQHHGAIANFSVQLLHARLSSNVPKLGEEINFWAESLGANPLMSGHVFIVCVDPDACRANLPRTEMFAARRGRPLPSNVHFRFLSLDAFVARCKAVAKFVWAPFLDPMVAAFKREQNERGAIAAAAPNATTAAVGAWSQRTILKRVSGQKQVTVKGLSKAHMDLADRFALLKPLYGELLLPEIPAGARASSHWAYGDLDVIYGCLSAPAVLQADELAEYDVISFHYTGVEDGNRVNLKPAVHGHLTLLQNTDKANRLWRLIPGIGKLLSDARARHAIDERVFSDALARHAKKARALAIRSSVDIGGGCQKPALARRLPPRRMGCCLAARGGRLLLDGAKEVGLFHVSSATRFCHDHVMTWRAGAPEPWAQPAYRVGWSCAGDGDAVWELYFDGGDEAVLHPRGVNNATRDFARKCRL